MQKKRPEQPTAISFVASAKLLSEWRSQEANGKNTTRCSKTLGRKFIPKLGDICLWPICVHFCWLTVFFCFSPPFPRVSGAVMCVARRIIRIAIAIRMRDDPLPPCTIVRQSRRVVVMGNRVKMSFKKPAIDHPQLVDTSSWCGLGSGGPNRIFVGFGCFRFCFWEQYAMS